VSHFNVAVILPPLANINGDRRAPTPDDAKLMATHLLAPFDENGEGRDGEWFADGTRWDWWVIGGRWDGAIRGLDWEPYKEPCRVCNGTGARDWTGANVSPEWIEECNGCNGCKGTGMQDVWPTDEKYQSVGTNVCRVSEMAEDYRPYAFVTPDGVWHERARMGFWGVDLPDEEGEEPEDKEKPYRDNWDEARKAHAKSLVVSIDCHV
jgi:hypothetical protein